MSLLLDSHLLLWMCEGSTRIPAAALREIEDPSDDVWFSAASIWELGVKYALRKPGYDVDPAALRAELLEEDYLELVVTSEHGAAVAELPPIHGDPFDRLLIAQARVEGLQLLTADRSLAEYGAPVRLI